MPGEDPFRELQEQLASLAAAAKSLREQRPSWLENILHPGRRARQEADFGTSLVAALKKTVHSIQEARARTTELELQGERLGRFKTDLDQLHAQQEQLVRESARAAQDWTDRAVEMRQQLEQLAREQEKINQIAGEQSSKHDQARNELSERIERLAKDQSEKFDRLVKEQSEKFDRMLSEQRERIDRLASAQTDLGNEFRERIQHVLDEQRVAIRQLSLKASEDAILSDRARRAAELKMEELAKRIPAPPA